MRSTRRKWFVLLLVVVLAAVMAYVLLRPRSLNITATMPSGAMVYARLDHLLVHIKELRSSKFWAGISQVNVPDILIHEGIPDTQVSLYGQWRDSIHGIITNPVFQQIFGREAALAIYPPEQGFTNGNWPASYSGLLIAARPEAKTRLTEVLAAAWSRHSKEWKTSQTRYKNVGLTQVRFKGEYPSVFYVRLNDLVFFALDERLLYRLIDVSTSGQGAIGQMELFEKSAVHFYPQSNGEFFIDVPRAREFLIQNLTTLLGPQKDQQVQFMRSRMEGLLNASDGIHAGAASFLAQRPLRAKWSLFFDPQKSPPELKRRNDCEPSAGPLMGMVPKDVILYQWMGCLNLAAQYQQFEANRQASAKEERVKENPLADLQKAWGLNIEKDILPVLGDELGWFVHGVEAGGFFPVPKFVVFLKVKDTARAEEILKKIVTTPVTLLQNDTYNNVKINFVTVPLIQSFRPSFAFIGDYLVLATSDKLIKQSLDVSKDPAAGLTAEDVFKERAKGTTAGQLISFMNLGEIARQCKTFVDLADKWFARKSAQADAEMIKLDRNAQALAQTIESQKMELRSLKERLEALRQEKLSLEAQVKAASVVMEAKDTLSQEGELSGSSVPDSVRPEKLLETKISQESALEIEAEMLRQDIERLTASQPDMADDLKDYEYQKADAQKYRYYITGILGPLVEGMGALSAQAVTTNVKDGVMESEMFLNAE